MEDLRPGLMDHPSEWTSFKSLGPFVHGFLAAIVMLCLIIGGAAGIYLLIEGV